MATITFPGVRAVDSEDLLTSPNLEAGDITISINSVVSNLPFALVEAGRSPIAITLTEEQRASNGVISIRDQTDPPEWVGPYDEAGPFGGTDLTPVLDELDNTIKVDEPLTFTNAEGGTDTVTITR